MPVTVKILEILNTSHSTTSENNVSSSNCNLNVQLSPSMHCDNSIRDVIRETKTGFKDMKRGKSCR